MNVWAPFFGGWLLGCICGMLFGVYIVEISVENLTNYRTGDLHNLIVQCESALPRNEHCKLEVKAVEK